MSTDTRIKLLYVGGAGRSGTTLVDMILTHLEGVFVVGELRWIWERGLEHNELCSCGQTFHDCPFWQQVLNEAYGGMDKLDVRHVHALRANLERIRRIPNYMLTRLQDESFLAAHDEYSEILCRLYRAICDVSGCRIIVDSSKSPPYGFILNQTASIDLRLLHLARDSRAVAYSWQRLKRRPEVHWEERWMPRFTVRQSTRNWLTGNIGAHLLARKTQQSLFIRYEDFVRSPQATLKKILPLMDMPDADLSFLCEGSFTPKTSHSLAGNPLRFSNQTITIRADSEWAGRMPLKHKALVTALTWPLLLRYRMFGLASGG